jgi:hypothetical protein
MVCMVLHPPIGALVHWWVLGDNSPNNLQDWHLRQYKTCTNSCLVGRWNNTSFITITSCLVWLSIIPTSYQGYNNLNKKYIPMWRGIRGRVAILLLCVNQFLQRSSFCFWVCISSFNNRASNYTSHEGSKFLGFACWCFVLFLNLSKSLCCVYHIWVVCFDFVVVACHAFCMFLKLLKLEMWSIIANGKFLRWDFKRLSIEFWLLQCDHVVLLFSSKE